MKRRLVILLAGVILVLAQIACGADGNGGLVEPTNTNLRSAAMCPAGGCE
jgi:hypothetical protein